MTARGVEPVLDILREHHSDKVAVLNLDQALRLCARDDATRKCFERPAPP